MSGIEGIIEAGISPLLLKQYLSELEPKTRGELHDYVLNQLGFDIESEVYGEQDSPLDFLADAFFEEVERALVFASRGSGKTRLLSILHFLNSRFKPGCWSTNVGAIRSQSRRAYDYFKEYFKPDSLFGGWLVAPPTMSRTVFKNDSVVEILTGGSERSVSGPRPQKFAGDEIDHWSLDIFEITTQITSAKPGIKAQSFFVSSRYHEFGLLTKLLSEAEERGIRVYTWNCWAVAAHCDLFPSYCKSCPLYEWVNPFSGEEEKLCGGEVGPELKGHLPIEDLMGKFFLGSSRIFAQQQLLLQAAKTGLVYERFGEGNIKEIPKGADTSSWNFCAGVDFGYVKRHPATIVVVAESPDGTHWVVDEWKRSFALPSEHREAARQLMEKWGIRLFWCDPSRPDTIASWQIAGLPAFRSPSRVVLDGVNKIRDRILRSDGSHLLFVSPSCKNLIKEMGETYHLRRGSEGVYLDKPAQIDNDLCDALRYLEGGGFQFTESLSSPGVPSLSRWHL